MQGTHLVSRESAVAHVDLTRRGGELKIRSWRAIQHNSARSMQRRTAFTFPPFRIKRPTRGTRRASTESARERTRAKVFMVEVSFRWRQLELGKDSRKVRFFVCPPCGYDKIKG